MRLIDADKNREDFKKTIYRVLIDDFSISKDKFNKIMVAFDSIPTAYNIDKVVEELEKKKEEVQRMRNTCVALSDLEVCDIENVTYERAIEIVKQGGVSDDVCEWNCDEYERWHTSCHYLADNDPLEYTYCPYCSKKIKAVE